MKSWRAGFFNFYAFYLQVEATYEYIYDIITMI